MSLTYPLLELVLDEKLKRPGPQELLGLHGRFVMIEALVDGLPEDVLELVVGTQVLLGPS